MSSIGTDSCPRKCPSLPQGEAHGNHYSFSRLTLHSLLIKIPSCRWSPLQLGSACLISNRNWMGDVAIYSQMRSSCWEPCVGVCVCFLCVCTDNRMLFTHSGKWRNNPSPGRRRYPSTIPPPLVCRTIESPPRMNFRFSGLVVPSPTLNSAWHPDGGTFSCSTKGCPTFESMTHDIFHLCPAHTHRHVTARFLPGIILECQPW